MACNLKWADGVQAKGHAFESLAVKTSIKPKIPTRLAGEQTEQAQEGLQEGFKFENPNVKDPCGCGKIFHA